MSGEEGCLSTCLTGDIIVDSKVMMVVEVIVVFVRRPIRVAVKLGRAVFISSITHNSLC